MKRTCNPADSRRGRGPRQAEAVLLIKLYPSLITICKRLVKSGEDRHNILDLKRTDTNPNWYDLAEILKYLGVYSKKTVWYDIHCREIALKVIKEVNDAR